MTFTWLLICLSGFDNVELNLGNGYSLWINLSAQLNLFYFSFPCFSYANLVLFLFRIFPWCYETVWFPAIIISWSLNLCLPTTFFVSASKNLLNFFTNKDIALLICSTVLTVSVLTGGVSTDAIAYALLAVDGFTYVPELGFTSFIF